MANREKLVRGGMQLLGGHAAVQFIHLLRNFCIARLLSPEDFGVAATFALTLSMLESISDLSFGKLLIQDRDGENPTFQAVLQTMCIARGFLMAAIIYAAADPLARAFDVPEAAEAYRWLALAPVLRGLVHLDIKRMQRSLSFSAEIRLLLISNLAGLVVAVGLAWLWRDYMAILWSVIVQSGAMCVGAHYLADRPYRLALRGDAIARIISFGWPLTLNGIVIMLATQGDRALVGARLSMTDLALYTVAAMLIGALQAPVMKVASGLALPWLSAVQTSPIFRHRSAAVNDALVLLAISVFLPISLLGARLISLIFGAEYVSPPHLVGLLALSATMKVIRGGPVIASMAVGDTKNLMLTNVIRSIGIVAAALALSLGGGLAAVAAGMCLGEIAACAAAVHRVSRVTKGPIGEVFRGPALAFSILTVALVLDAVLPQHAIALRAALAIAMIVAATGAVLWFSPELLRQARIVLSRVGAAAP